MKKIIILLACLLFTAQAAERNVLTTYGDGIYEVAPDTVVINLGVQREGLTAEDAQNSLRKALANVLEALKPLDIPGDGIKTDGYSLYPVYKQRKNADGNNYETEEIDRYRTYIRLSIEIHQIPQVGKIADTAIKAGVNKVENISFTLKNQEAAKSEALKIAIRNAQEKAKLLAEKFNVGLGTPVSIQESGSYSAPRLRNTSMLMAEAKSAGFDLPEGKVQITSRVDVSYEIQTPTQSVTQAPPVAEPVAEIPVTEFEFAY
jgi:uncharacterized protein YggE